MPQALFTIYGIFILVGGIIGYSKAKSKMSLIMGLISSSFIFIGVSLSQTQPMTGYKLLSIVALALTIVFINRLVKTKSFMPSGLLVMLSAAALCYGTMLVFG